MRTPGLSSHKLSFGADQTRYYLLLLSYDESRKPSAGSALLRVVLCTTRRLLRCLAIVLHHDSKNDRDCWHHDPHAQEERRSCGIVQDDATNGPHQ